jgi:hypothetical protein
MPECKDPVILAQTSAQLKAEADSKRLKLAIREAIRRQAVRWGIRYDQAAALLLDRVKLA